MRKFFVSICVTGALLGMQSCRSLEKVVPLSNINGEWNFVEVSGVKLVPTEGQNLPFIGFDTTTGKIYGNSGCNRMMGNFDVNAKPGMLELGQMASTRMMCPDMTTEQNVLNALGQVKGYRMAGKNKLYLCNASNRPVAMLEKRNSDVSLSVLKGEWQIKDVNGETIPGGLEKQPFLAFNLKNKTVHGQATCNLLNGTFVTDKSNPKSISFPGFAATMMSCPNMELESKILQALNSVKSFDVLAGGGIGFYDEDKSLVIVLERK